jgi:hypothetical protein
MIRKCLICGTKYNDETSPKCPICKLGEHPEPHKWSRYGKVCLKCGLNIHPHKARGICSKCYRRKSPKLAHDPKKPVVKLLTKKEIWLTESLD